MTSVVEKLTNKGLITPPDFVVSNTVYEVVMGSNAYGVSTDTSDFDTIGVCILPKHVVFPHLAGEIEGFGRQKKRFNVYQKHHIFDKDAQRGAGRTYDLNVYNIVHYFYLCMENNPNMVDSLFVPRECILSSTGIGEMIREKRHLFLHKGSWHRYKGYAYQQLSKMKKSKPVGKRAELIERFGFDVKFAYHAVRLLYEAEMILLEHDLDLRRHREHLKAIRRGEVSEDEIRSWAAEKEKALERAYETSSLRYEPDELVLKNLLLDCLEQHYGNLAGAVVRQGEAATILDEMAELAERWNRLKSVTPVDLSEQPC